MVCMVAAGGAPGIATDSASASGRGTGRGEPLRADTGDTGRHMQSPTMTCRKITVLHLLSFLPRPEDNADQGKGKAQ